MSFPRGQKQAKAVSNGLASNARVRTLSFRERLPKTLLQNSRGEKYLQAGGGTTGEETED